MRGRVADATLSILRIVAGFLFFAHGAQKILGWFTESGPMVPPRTPPAFPELVWFAGMLELVGGILLIVGLLTRPVAFILAGEMAVAYFKAHAPQGFWPILNRGELAALYSFLFLFFAANGGGRLSLDHLFRRGKRPA